MKIISFADMHLDSAFVGFSDVERIERREMLSNVFCKIISLVKREDADLLLIAGDLFDIPNPTKEIESLVVSELSNLRCPVIITPGNHDYYVSGGVYDRMPENVFVFKTNELSSVYLDKHLLAVDGYAFTSESYNENPISKYKPAERKYTHILLAHTSLVSSSTYAPMDLSELSNTDYRFVFLGHVHTDNTVYEAGDAKVGFSGIPQGRSIDEPINGGIRIVEIKDGTVISEELVDVSEWNNIISETDTDGVTSDAQLVQRIVSELSLHGLSENDIVRVILTGEHDYLYTPNTLQILKLLKNAFEGITFSVKNSAFPQIKKEALMKDPTIVGILYRTLFENERIRDEYDYDTRIRAFRLAVASIRGDNISPETV